MFLDSSFLEIHEYTAVFQPYFVEFPFDKFKNEGLVN